MSSKPRHLGQIEIKLFLQPVNGVSRPVGEHLDQIVPGEMLSGRLGVVEKDLCRVLDVKLDLGRRSGSVDAARRFCTVSSHEAHLVQKKDGGTSFEESVGGGQARETLKRYG